MAQQYELIRVRRGGWLIPKYQHAFGRHPVGALQVTQEYLPDLHRHSLVAKLLPPVPNQGTEPIPPLYDVTLLHWHCDLITLAGFERHLKTLFWPKLGGKYFLHPDPRKVSFSTAIISGGPKGAMGFNEYGHFDLDGPRAQELRKVEWRTFQAAKDAWDERDRRAGRVPPTMADLKDYW